MITPVASVCTTPWVYNCLIH